MSAWMGLHHPERHRVTAIDGYAECNICGTGCAIDGACRCCLAAEVEALRARNETLIATIQRQDSTFERQMEEHEELEALRAQVQRVREACEPFGPMGSIAVWRVLRALNGDSDE